MTATMATKQKAHMQSKPRVNVSALSGSEILVFILFFV
jgi:hypothetical protein